MLVHGFYPISLASVMVFAWQYSLNPLSTAMLLVVLWANVAVHEFGHAAATCWTRGNVTGLSITPWYGNISVEQDDRLAFAMIALAGPVAGIAAGSTALVVLGQATGPSVVTTFGAALRVVLWAGICDNCLNLLPVWVLDGGQFVKALLEWRRDRRAIERPREAPEAPPAKSPLVAFLERTPVKDTTRCRRLLSPAIST